MMLVDFTCILCNAGKLGEDIWDFFWMLFYLWYWLVIGDMNFVCHRPMSLDVIGIKACIMGRLRKVRQIPLYVKDVFRKNYKGILTAKWQKLKELLFLQIVQ